MDHGKTHIIGRAFLNEDLFERYASLALSEGLLEAVEGGYRVTPSGITWLEAVRRVLEKRTALASALSELARISDRSPAPRTWDAPPVERSASSLSAEEHPPALDSVIEELGLPGTRSPPSPRGEGAGGASASSRVRVDLARGVSPRRRPPRRRSRP